MKEKGKKVFGIILAGCLIFQLSGLSVYAGNRYGYIGSWNPTEDGVADESMMSKEIMGVGDYIEVESREGLCTGAYCITKEAEVAGYIEIEPDKNSGKVEQIQGWVESQNADAEEPYQLTGKSYYTGKLTLRSLPTGYKGYQVAAERIREEYVGGGYGDGDKVFEMPTQPTRLTFTPVPISYQVTFYGNGGTMEGSTEITLKATYDQNIGIPAFQQTGYVLTGFQRVKEEGESLSATGTFCNLTVTDGAHIYYEAQWEPETEETVESTQEEPTETQPAIQQEETPTIVQQAETQQTETPIVEPQAETQQAQIINAGTVTLTEGVLYRFGTGNRYLIAGDSTVYAGNTDFYVSKTDTYTIRLE